MLFPALAALADDHEIPHAAWRVYLRLARHDLDFRDVRPVKLHTLTDALHLSKPTVIDALDYLVRAGYLIEHARTWREVRQFTLAWARQPPVRALECLA